MTTLRNTFGLACPRCGNDANLDIQIFCMASLTPQGSEPIGDHEWDDGSFCLCPACGHTGDVSDFRVEEVCP